MKLQKKLITGALIGCMLLSSAVYAAEAEIAEESAPPVQTLSAGNEASPYTVYLCDADVSFAPLGGTMNIIVTTSAFKKVSHIYHDITVYKNGSWYSSDRYENWGKSYLKTTLKIPASSGDRFDVYVDHYAVSETMHTENYAIY